MVAVKVIAQMVDRIIFVRMLYSGVAIIMIIVEIIMGGMMYSRNAFMVGFWVVLDFGFFYFWFDEDCV